MAIFGKIEKYKVPQVNNYNYTRDIHKDNLITKAIQEARMQGFTENCEVILLTGEKAQITSFNTLQSLAFDSPSDYLPKVCRVFYRKNNKPVYDNIDHNELELYYTNSNTSYG